LDIMYSLTKEVYNVTEEGVQEVHSADLELSSQTSRTKLTWEGSKTGCERGSKS
jgi:hypothetical protein